MSILELAIEETTNTATTEDYTGNNHNLFPIDSQPLSSVYGTIKGKKGLFVDGENINIVSDKYEIHQPIDIAREFYTVSKSHGLEVNRVLSNPKNGGLLLSAKYASQLLGGDNCDINLTFYTAHDGKNKTFLSLDTLRIACFNQLPILYKNKSRFIFSEKHYKNALDIDKIGSFLQAIPESIREHNDKLNTLKDTKLSTSDFIDLYVKHCKLDKESVRFDSKVASLKSVYYNATGQDLAQNNTAYKALQAITYINTHEVRKTAMQAENSVIKGGNDSLVWLDNLLELS